jgi:hypothetical protein
MFYWVVNGSYWFRLRAVGEWWADELSLIMDWWVLLAPNIMFV